MKRDNDIDQLFDKAQRERRCVWSTGSAQRNKLMRRAAVNELVRPLPRFFARRDYWNRLSYHERIMHMMRTVAAMRKTWVLCLVSAAAVWGLTENMYLHGTIHIAKQYGNRTRNSECFTFHHIPEPAATTRHGVLVTGLLQTVFDCARMCEFPDGLAICDAALRKHLLTKDDLIAFCERNKRCAGIQQARSVIGFADGRSENGGESKARGHFIEWGFESPELQAWFRNPVTNASARVDFLWRLPDGRMIIGELDGREKYINPEMIQGQDVVDTVLRERERETNLGLSGNVVIVRFTYMELIKHPQNVRQKLKLAGVPLRRQSS